MNNYNEEELKKLSITELATLAKVKIIKAKEARKSYPELQGDRNSLKRNYYYFPTRGIILTLKKARNQLIYEIELKTPKRTPAKPFPKKPNKVKSVIGNLVLKGKQAVSFFSGFIDVIKKKLQMVGDLATSTGKTLYMIVWRYIYGKTIVNKLQIWEKALRKFLKTQVLDQWSFDKNDDCSIDWSDNRLNFIAQIKEVNC
jgi:hypothetical protein